MNPKLDQMTFEERIEYLKNTEHLVVKWVYQFIHPTDKELRYHRETIPHLTKRLSEATVYDTRLQLPANHDGYKLTAVTKKELFEARLKNK